MDEPHSSSVERSLKRLTVAVWILFAVVLTNLGLFIYFTVVPRPIRVGHAVVGNSFPPRGLADDMKYNGFWKWSVKKQIAAASVIVLAKYRKHGDMLTPVVTRIVKKTPGTVFYYKVGDKLARQSVRIEKGVSYDGGLLIFFTSSPAQFRFLTTYDESRLLGYGDMPLKMFLGLVRAQEQEAAVTRKSSRTFGKQ